MSFFYVVVGNFWWFVGFGLWVDYFGFMFNCLLIVLVFRYLITCMLVLVWYWQFVVTCLFSCLVGLRVGLMICFVLCCCFMYLCWFGWCAGWLVVMLFGLLLFGLLLLVLFMCVVM